MLLPGAPLPDATVWTGPREHASVRELAAGATTLFLFYLFDWSST